MVTGHVVKPKEIMLPELYIETSNLERTKVSELEFPYALVYTSLGGWELWGGLSPDSPLIAGERHTNGIKLDVDGTVLVNTLKK